MFDAKQRQAHIASPAGEPARQFCRTSNPSIVFAGILAGFFTATALAIDRPSLPNGVAAGDMGATTAVLWARPGFPGKMTFTYATDADLSQNVRTRKVMAPDISLPVKVSLTGLKSNTEYFYSVTDQMGEESKGRFRTLPGSDSTAGLVFGALGAVDAYYEMYPAIRNIPEQSLEYLFQINTELAGLPDGKFVPSEIPEFAGAYVSLLSDRCYPELGCFPNYLAMAHGSTGLFTDFSAFRIAPGFAGGAAPDEGTVPFNNETSLYQNAVAAFRSHTPVRSTRYGETGDPLTAQKPKFQRSLRFGKNAIALMLDTGSFNSAQLAEPANPLDQAQVAQFLTDAFAPGRTLLGKTQLADVKRALREAQAQGIRWKFVMLENIVGNWGVMRGAGRYEGYAAERAELLGFIEDKGIRNVVFVTESGLFGVNNLQYQKKAFGPQLNSGAWEIVLPSGAASLNTQWLMQEWLALGTVTPEQMQTYASLPIAPDSDDLPNDKDDFAKTFHNQIITQTGYDPIGLEGSAVPATLKAGDYFSGHSMGWAKFQIEPETQKLIVTVYGVPEYVPACACLPEEVPAGIIKEAAEIAALVPQVISRFEVLPQ